jgi:hypothetical protein
MLVLVVLVLDACASGACAGGAHWFTHVLSLKIDGAGLHWYGKEGVTPGRKLGHFTIVADSLASMRIKIAPLHMPEVESFLAPEHELGSRWGDARIRVHSLYTLIHTVHTLYTLIHTLLVHSSADPKPVVGIIMGSDSDLPCMKVRIPAVEYLRQVHMSCAPLMLVQNCAKLCKTVQNCAKLKLCPHSPPHSPHHPPHRPLLRSSTSLVCRTSSPSSRPTGRPSVCTSMHSLQSAEV